MSKVVVFTCVDNKYGDEEIDVGSPKYKTWVEIDCDANLDAVVEQVSTALNNLALSWTKYPGTVTIKHKE